MKTKSKILENIAATIMGFVSVTACVGAVFFAAKHYFVIAIVCWLIAFFLLETSNNK